MILHKLKINWNQIIIISLENLNFQLRVLEVIIKNYRFNNKCYNKKIKLDNYNNEILLGVIIILIIKIVMVISWIKIWNIKKVEGVKIK